jgi:hypothetical protein
MMSFGRTSQAGEIQMTFEQRMLVVKQWLKDEILPRFTAPTNVDKTRTLQDVVDAVNANIPRVENPDQFKSHLDSVGRKVVQNAKSRTLPVPKDFIDACREATKSKAISDGVPKSVRFCPFAITEKRVRAGEAIASTWLSELQLAQLFANTSLTMEDMQPYIVAHKHNKEGDNNEQNGVYRGE